MLLAVRTSTPPPGGRTIRWSLSPSTLMLLVVVPQGREVPLQMLRQSRTTLIMFSCEGTKDTLPHWCTESEDLSTTLLFMLRMSQYTPFSIHVSHQNSFSEESCKKENVAPDPPVEPHVGGGSFVGASFSSFSFPPPPAPPPPHPAELLGTRFISGSLPAFSVRRLGKELGPGMRRLWILPKLVIPWPLAGKECKIQERGTNSLPCL